MCDLDCQQAQSIHHLVLADVILIQIFVLVYKFSLLFFQQQKILVFWIKYIIINEKCLPVRSAYSSAAKNRFSLLLLSVVTVTKALWFGEYTI